MSETSDNRSAVKLRKLSNTELSIFCTQISLFLKSGVTLAEGLELMLEDWGSGNFGGVMKAVSKGVKNREELHTALGKSGVFPDYLVKMAEIGELSGNLDEIMASLARFYEREQKLRQRIKNAITYPCVLIVMMAAIVMLLIIKVLPMFGEILQSVRGEMPGMVAGLMAFGQFVSAYFVHIVLALIVICAAYRIYRNSPGGKKAIDRLKATLPVFKGVNGKIAAERFSSAMAFLLSSGIDFDRALELSKDILNNSYMTRKIEECEEMSKKGKNIYDAIYKTGIFPRIFTRMLAIGFKTGDLDGVMKRLSEIYEEEVDSALKKLTGIIEPAFVAVLSVIVGIILISVMLPLINIMSSIG